MNASISWQKFFMCLPSIVPKDGGKTVVRVPAVLDGYALSICSGDFNECIGKTVSVDYRGSFMFTGDWEISEWKIAHTFSHAEKKALQQNTGAVEMSLMKRANSFAAGSRWPILPKREDRQVCLITLFGRNANNTAHYVWTIQKEETAGREILAATFTRSRRVPC